MLRLGHLGRSLTLCSVALSIPSAVRAVNHRSLSMLAASASSYIPSRVSCAEVVLVPMFTDNYGHILIDKETNSAALIDPADPEAVVKTLRELNLDLRALLITHKHNDHVGGNEYFSKAYPGVNIYGPKYEPIPYLTHALSDGDAITFGSLNIQVIHTPCHTKGHIVYLVTGLEDTAPILFPGDTLFVGGCGRFFEGTATDMLKNMDFFATLPSDTKFYCAHEYTESNYKFLANICPELCKNKYLEIQNLRKENIPTVPSTIGEEKQYNLFMRCRDASTQMLTHTIDSPVETMGMLRKMKNEFK